MSDNAEDDDEIVDLYGTIVDGSMVLDSHKVLSLQKELAESNSIIEKMKVEAKRKDEEVKYKLFTMVLMFL